MKKAFLSHPLPRIILVGLLAACGVILLLGPPGSVTDERRVIITDNDLEQLRIGWYRRWQRSPTPEEMRGQIEQFVRQEVLYREALARGYDKDDPLVRRAMQQKMEFLGQAQAVQDTLAEQEIEAFYALRREQYRVPGAITFTHIYYNLDQRGSSAENDARRDLERIRGSRPESLNLSALGDRFLLPQQYANVTKTDVQAEFGQGFAETLVGLAPNEWNGPIASGYGLHLVYVGRREQSRIPELDEVRRRVVQDMQTEMNNAARELFYTEILRNYQVVYRGEALDIIERKE